MFLFLHRQGYSFFTIPKLTYPEINALVDAKNKEIKKQEQESKKMEMKSRAKRKGRYR